MPRVMIAAALIRRVEAPSRKISTPGITPSTMLNWRRAMM